MAEQIDTNTEITALQVIQQKYNEDLERIKKEKDDEIARLSQKLKEQEEKHVKELQALFLGRNENLNTEEMSVEDRITKSLEKKFGIGE